MRTQQKIDKLQQKWHGLKQNPQESLQDNATRTNKLAEELDNTPITITRADIGQRWRCCLGRGFNSLNELIELTNIIPQKWAEDQLLLGLVSKAEKHLEQVQESEPLHHPQSNDFQENNHHCQLRQQPLGQQGDGAPPAENSPHQPRAPQ
eukprot:2319085-Ditylum_brightwellii.AAC.1